ncbi:DUF1801 domain-containing protein [Vibrio makurazakiensis]|uniref:DUF1801 domain-containing protein n=1 Tax=Vibrio makurazakiensis TaxID=2910250 RepID=UPI003D0ADC51
MNPLVKQKIASYPDDVQTRLSELRSLILDLAESVGASPVEETLKWGEPSYIVKSGSTIRIDWKLKSPSNYFIYFNCKTRLVDTFRELHSDRLDFQGNRAIVLSLGKPLPVDEITQCLLMALTYQKIKHLPLLGA